MLSSFIPFVLPLVFVFWAVVGGFQCLRAPRLVEARKQKAAAKQKKLNASDRTLLLRARLMGAFWLVLGLVGWWFNGLVVGLSSALPPIDIASQGSLEAIVAERASPLLGEGVVGMAIAVVAGDREDIFCYGRRSLDGQVPDGDTLFEIGSITKTFTGSLLALAVARGQLRLDQSVHSLLPEGMALAEGQPRDITLEHLTTHSAGLPRLPPNQFTVRRIARAAVGGDPYGDYSVAEFRQALATVELASEPGTRSLYSNFSAGLLGYALAQGVAGDYGKLVRGELFLPLGMSRTLVRPPEETDQLAAGYRASARLGPLTLSLRSSNWILPNHLAGAGAILSTASDMTRYLKAHMGRGDSDLVSALALSHQGLFEDSDGDVYGMNWIRGQKDAVGTIIWHNGGTGGFRSFLGFVEGGQTGVVILSNTTRSVDTLGFSLLETIHQELQTRDE